jgi:hypothetical protein
MRKFAVGNRSLRSARQFRVLSAAVRLCWYFCWYRGANVHGELRHSSTEKQIDKHSRWPPGLSSDGPTSSSQRRRWRKSNAAGSSRCATPRPSRCLSCAWAASRVASARCAGRTSSVRTCSLSCVHRKPGESWKPATACAASVSKSSTMPMSKAAATIHSAT